MRPSKPIEIGMLVAVLDAIEIEGKTSVAEKMRQLHRSTRLVFDYLRMTKNSTRISALVSG